MFITPTASSAVDFLVGTSHVHSTRYRIGVNILSFVKRERLYANGHSDIARDAAWKVSQKFHGVADLVVTAKIGKCFGGFAAIDVDYPRKL